MMIRKITFVSVWCFLMAASPAGLFAQFNPYGNVSNPYELSADQRVRRAYREQAVAMVGPNARDFVERQGDMAVAAMFACSRPVAVKLAEFHASGELGRLPRPRELLYIIAQPRNGDDVALFAIHHARELNDLDSFDACLLSPLDYAMGLKALETGAAEARARRLNQAATTTPWLSPGDAKMAIFVSVGTLVVIGLVLWRRKKASMC